MDIKKFKDTLTNIDNIKQDDLTKKDKTELICENELNKIKIICITKRLEESNIKIKRYLEQFWNINRNNESLLRNNKNLKAEINNLNIKEISEVKKLKDENEKIRKEKEEYRNNIINLNKKNRD